jgi:hypothetical protein
MIRLKQILLEQQAQGETIYYSRCDPHPETAENYTIIDPKYYKILSKDDLSFKLPDYLAGVIEFIKTPPAIENEVGDKETGYNTVSKCLLGAELGQAPTISNRIFGYYNSDGKMITFGELHKQTGEML